MTVWDSIITMMVAMIIKYWVFLLIILALGCIVEWKLFKKAGEPGWKIFIPIYNRYTIYKCFWSTSAFGVRVLLAVGSQYLIRSQFQRFTIDSVFDPNTYLNLLIGMVPLFVLKIMSIILRYRIAKTFGHGLGMALGLIFLPVIFYPILVWGDDRRTANSEFWWNDTYNRRYEKTGSDFSESKVKTAEEAETEEKAEEPAKENKSKQRKIMVAVSAAVIVIGFAIIIGAFVQQFKKEQKIFQSQTLNYEIEGWMFYSNSPVDQFLETFGEYTETEEEKAFWESKKHYTYIWEDVPLVQDMSGQLTVKYLGGDLQSFEWVYQDEDSESFAILKENLEKALEREYTLDSEEMKNPDTEECCIERGYVFEKNEVQYFFTVRFYNGLSKIELEFEPLYEYKN